MGSSNVVLYAVWQDNTPPTTTYTVTFVDWDGSVLKTQTVLSGQSASAPANPSRVGYTFTGWDKVFSNIVSNLVVTAQYTPYVAPPSTSPDFRGETEIVDLFFRGDDYNTFSFTGYGLDDSGSVVSGSFSDSYAQNVSLAFGFRVWLIDVNEGMVELTDGLPVAVNIFLPSSAPVSGYVSAQWVCPDVHVRLGDQALYVVMYSAAEDGANMVARAYFVSPVLMTDHIIGSSWVFQFWLDYSGSSFSVSWSGRRGMSGIGNVVIASPSDFDVMFFKLVNLDLAGFVLYPYLSILGEFFYLLFLIAVLGAYYIWHGKVSIILVMLLIFGSAGGLVFLFIPLPANLLVWALMAVALAVLLFRVFR
jgi:hypothetical protein